MQQLSYHEGWDYPVASLSLPIHPLSRITSVSPNLVHIFMNWSSLGGLVNTSASCNSLKQ